MSAPSDITEAASALSQRRWTKPENVAARLDRLAEHIRRTVDSLPPLSAEQRAKLTAALTPPADAA